MSNSIYPLLPGLSPISPEANLSLPLSNFPPQIIDAIKNATSVQLEILPNQNKIINAVLHINETTFDVVLPDNLVHSNQSESKFFDVKIGNNNQLFLLKNSENIAKPSIITSSQANIIQVDLQPIKISDFISSHLKDIKISPYVIKQLIQEITPLNVSLSSIGQTLEDKNPLQPLQKLISNFESEIGAKPLSQVKEQLQTVISDLIGKKIEGEVVGRFNEITTIKTPLGNTFFSSKIKLPQAEHVILTITSQVSGLKQELKFLDSLLNILQPRSNINIKPEFISSYPQLKNLARLNELDFKTFSSIVNKLPFRNEHLLENIYDFYQASIHKDLSKWIKPDILQSTTLKAETKNIITEELNLFLSSSLKETPSWRIVEMPLFDATTFKPLKIALKKEQDRPQDDTNNQDKFTRFIVETGFSKLGDFQFDGLSNQEKRRFDLIIRTSKKLDDDFCSNIINLFKKSLYNLNYAGTIKINLQEDFINFQTENSITQGIYI